MPAPPTHYCSYCRYYGTDPLTGEVNFAKDFVGTRAQVVRHAHVHPIGNPEDFPVLMQATRKGVYWTWLPPKYVDAGGNELVVRSPRGEVVPGTLIGVTCENDEDEPPAYRLVFMIDPAYREAHRAP